MNAEEIAAGAERGDLLILDVRDAHSFAQTHAARAYNLPFRRQAYGATAKHALMGWQKPVAVMADHSAVAEAAAGALEAAGIEVAARYGDGMAGWRAAGLGVVEVSDLTVDALRDGLDTYQVIDVREPYEWRSGVVPGAKLLPLSALEGRVAELDKDGNYAVVCASGNRSAAASAWLAERGYRVANVVGGMALWMGAGHPTAPASEDR